MKKILLVLVFVFTLVSCGSNNLQEGNNIETKENKIQQEVENNNATNVQLNSDEEELIKEILN